MTLGEYMTDEKEAGSVYDERGLIEL